MRDSSHIESMKSTAPIATVYARRACRVRADDAIVNADAIAPGRITMPSVRA
jgi:hypothetical protein